MNMTYHPRNAEGLLRDALETMPVVVVTGMRQTGKSTLLREQFPERSYVTLDDFAPREAARTNPEALLDREGPLTIDEAQKAPELLEAVKRVVDRRRTPGRFLLSGSANFALLKGAAETLAGRAATITLRPMSRREIRRASTPPFLPAFFKSPKVAQARAAVEPVTAAEILTGGMPPVAAGRPKSPSIWFQGFEQTYLERDVRAITQVGDLVAFRTLLKLAALRTGQILNQSELGRDAKLNAVTTGRWLDLLETSYGVTRLPPYLGNRTSRVVKAPKLLVADSGLAAHLAGVGDLRPEADEPLRGALFETYLAQNLEAILGAYAPGASLHYWCVSGRGEVDFIVESGRDCVALELKAATRWGGEDLGGLRTFLAATPRCRAAVLVHNGTESVKLGERLWAIPLGRVIA